MFKLPGAPQSLLDNTTHRLCTCWKITRLDGTILRFTDHDRTLTINDDNSGGFHPYTPAGGINSTAHQKNDSFQQRNVDLLGFLDSDAISHDDLRAGRYRGAKINAFVLDWRFPFAGLLWSAYYWVTTTKFNGETWEAQLEGLTTKLNAPVGRVYGRTCDHILGDAGCQFDKATVTVTGTVNATVVIRSQFTSDLPHSKVDGYYNYGEFTWTTGLNAGIATEVNLYDGAANTFTLMVDAPFDIQVGDQFHVVAGCDRLFTTCKTKFSNAVNFGGFPFMPGSDKMLLTPNSV